MRNFTSAVVVLAVLAFGASAGFAQSVTITSPASGATVASPMHVTASATGGSYPIAAMRLYVDNQSGTTVYASTLDTYTTLSSGSHYVVVVAWDSTGQSFSHSMNVTVGSTAPAPPSPSTSTATTSTTGVTIASPANGATVTSPVAFSASAAAPAGRTITAMRVYLDSTSVYLANAASLNTAVTAGLGQHYAVVQAWDNTGAVYKSSAIINVAAPATSGGSTSGSGTTSGSGSTTVSGPYQSNFDATSNWMATQFLPDGALMYSTERINPYYSNLAAAGLVKDPKRYVQVQQWMNWYINHLNWPDKWGMYGTMYDYNIVNGQEVSSGDADSTDSYAATFLSLAWAYYQTGDPVAQGYVRGITYQLDSIAGVLLQTQQSDGLTWAKPDYQIKYLMDNCEAYRGLRDLAALYQALGDTTKQAYFNAAADSMLQGIQGMWLNNGTWAVYKDGIGRFMAPTMSTWYPDATAQVFPVLYQVVPASDPRSQQSYAAFNAAWPGWTSLSFNTQDEFPWVMVADAAALMGDNTRANQYIGAIQQKYVNTGFPWTWYSMEAGWFMRLNSYMMGVRPF